MEQRLRDYLKGRFAGYDDRLSREEDLNNVVDSLGLFELVAFIEEEFAISIPASEFSPQRFSSIQQILEFVDELRAGEPRQVR